jgi:hypothetical protein
MNKKDAIKLSDDLEEAGFHHEISIGVHKHLNPSVQCLVNVMASMRGFSFAEVKQLESIANQSGMHIRVKAGIDSTFITFQTGET